MEFCSDSDREMFYTFKRLIDDNSGLFRSHNQSNFFLRQANKDILTNIPTMPEQTKLLICGYVRWADYGIRSVRRVEWLYVLDAAGICEQYKLKFRYSEDGRYSEVSGADLVWKRKNDVVIPVFKKEPESNWIGIVGDRVKITAKIISKTPVETAFGVCYLTTMVTDEGNIIKYWNSIFQKIKDSRRYAEIGETVEFMAAIKTHDIFNNRKETIISRATKAIIK